MMELNPTPLPITITFNPRDVETGIGSSATTTLILNRAPNGLSGYNLTLSLSDPSIAEIVSVSFPSWATIYYNSTLPADSVLIKAVDLYDQVGAGATNINLATLTIRGDKEGTTDIIITVTKIDDDNGNPINPSTDPGHLIVGPTPTPTPTVTPTPSPSPTPTPTPTPTPVLGECIFPRLIAGTLTPRLDRGVIFYRVRCIINKWITPTSPTPVLEFSLYSEEGNEIQENLGR